MGAREDLPKVSIETEQDWKRIQHNLSIALFARLDTELESLGRVGEKDALLPHLHQFLENIFDIARPNLRINGRTMGDPIENEDDVEPFDEALDRHIWSLSDQRLKWDKEIADRRRIKPQVIQDVVLASLTQHHLDDLDVTVNSAAHDDSTSKQFDRELEQTLSNTVSLAPRLLQFLRSQQHRADRIRSVSTEMKAPKPAAL